MHHRRNSSLAVIDRGLVPSAASVPSITITSTLDKQYEQQQLQQQQQHPQFHPSTIMAIVRRRIRPIAILLAVSAFLLLLLMGGVFRNGSSSASRLPSSAANDGDSREPLANRPYPPSLAPGRIPPHGAGTDDIADDSKPINPYKGKGATSSTSSTSGGAPLKLTLAEELGAVVAYLTSLGANARIPNTIDPSRPIDAELILGFNTRSARASAEVAELVRETWEINPVVMFGEVRVFFFSLLLSLRRRLFHFAFSGRFGRRFRCHSLYAHP